MSPAEIIVLLLLAVGVVAAIRRNLRKGVPCECGHACCDNCAGCKARGGPGCQACAFARKTHVGPAPDGLHRTNRINRAGAQDCRCRSGGEPDGPGARL